jgi:ribosomal protein S18 acetylase RimI-like enzyme
MVTYLKWDSKFFKKRIARINIDASYSLGKLRDSLRLFFQKKYDCGYLLIPSGKKELIDYCINHHFFLADRKIVMKKKTQRFDGRSTINIQTGLSGNQVESIKKLTHQIAKKSRFYKDPHFKARAFELYGKWIENSISQKSYRCFFAVKNNQPVGLLTLKIKNGDPYIELFGVSASYRRLGIGKALLQTADTWASKSGLKRIFVTTQSDNDIAVLVYKKYGFTNDKITYIFHVWNKHDKNSI